MSFQSCLLLISTGCVIYVWIYYKEHQPDQITRSTPTDNIYRLFCLPTFPRCFQHRDMALPCQASSGTYFWVRMYCVSSNMCWGHLRVCLSCVRNLLDFLHTVALSQSARMQSWMVIKFFGGNLVYFAGRDRLIEMLWLWWSGNGDLLRLKLNFFTSKKSVMVAEDRKKD